MSGPLIGWLRSLCECCDDGCDCGCVLDCPRHKSPDSHSTDEEQR